MIRPQDVKILKPFSKDELFWIQDYLNGALLSSPFLSEIRNVQIKLRDESDIEPIKEFINNVYGQLGWGLEFDSLKTDNGLYLSIMFILPDFEDRENGK